MLLKSIEIQGFKSFPDKTSLHFGEGITAVVGPNGSGKSNISDAVRWVLGEQSTRSLRGHRMEDVIFGGTATRKAVGFAQVSLYIDNTSRRLPFDADEVEVTRKYYRSGESEYSINRATVRLKDIHELFMDTGLGRDGYSMIGQGKIDSIVSSRSDERRDIFEEAAGISRYRYRKLEAERRLKAAEENLLRLRDILSELESRVGPLKIQSEKAEKFLRLAGEKRNLEIGLWLLNLTKLKDRLREQEVKISLAASQHTGAGEELDAIAASLEEMTAAAGELLTRVEEVRRQAAQSEEEVARVEGEIAVFENTLYHNEETIARLTREGEQSRTSDSEIQQEVAAHEAKIAEKSQFIEERRSALESAQESLIQLQNEGTQMSRQIENLSFELNSLSAKTADARVRMMTARSSAAELSGRRTTAQESALEYRNLLTGLEAEREALEKDAAGCAQRILESENALRGYEYRLQGRVEKVKTLKEQADKLRLDMSEKSRRAQLLEDLEKNLEGFAHSVKLVMQQAGQGALRGIHGPLSRIIQAPPEYAVAIEVALGAAMQNIVVGTEEDAKRAIRFLKEKNGGRATFLPLTSIKGRQLSESGLSNLYGFIGTADTLVDFDGQYGEIVRSVLGRVVVAEDLDSAVLIAKKYEYRFKIVTLDGQVINAGGSLTGGSMAKSAGLLSRAHEIKGLREEAENIGKKLAGVEEQLKATLSEQAACEADIVAAKAEFTTAQEDKIRVESELKRVTQQISERRELAEKLEQELKTADGRLLELKNEETAAATEIDRYAVIQAEKETALRELNGGRDELAAGRERLSEEITAIRMEILEAEKDISTHRDAITALELRRENEARRLLGYEEEIARIRQENAETGGKIEECKAKIAELKVRAAQAAEEIEALHAKRMETEAASAALRMKEREKLEERERLSGELARLEERKNAMAEEYDEIIRKLFDEYELTRSEAEDLGIEIENAEEARKRLAELKSKIRALGSVNPEAIEEYKEVKTRFDFLTVQVEDLETTKAELTRLINQLTQQMQELFTEKFEIINKHFGKTFAELFGGGQAQLKLTDPANVLETGIEILAQPPGKSVSIIEQLSGGEKALIAIAIYFAIMKVNPPPFCVLDEVEAALDEVNVTKFAEYLRLMSVATQFIIITHRRGTMEEADVLYGVTMQEKGVSKLLRLNVAELEQKMNITA